MKFKQYVHELVALIPQGRVMTYGDIASLCGHPRSARQVGGLAHFGPDNLPWHRVVNKSGGLASGFPGGKKVQQTLLEAEGLRVTDFRIVNFEIIRWRPM